MRFWVGGYSEGERGTATGIGVLRTEGDEHAAGALGFAGNAVTVAGSPSWVAPHPTLGVVYAAHEVEGVVRAYRRTGDETLRPLGEPVAAGSAVCHVAVAPDGASLVASSRGDGSVVRMPLDAAGGIRGARAGVAASDPYESSTEPSPAESRGETDLSAAAAALRAAAGSEYAELLADVGREHTGDPDSGRADGPPRTSRAHQAVHLPGGLLATSDLGFDLVRIWRADDMRPVDQVVLPRGSGPRHLRWHPSGHLYVLTEYSREVFVLGTDRAERWRLIAGTVIPGVLDSDTGAELAASRRHEFLYAGVRGSDTVATLRIAGDGDRVEFVALDEAGVTWPRHHLVVDDILLVAGERSNDVVSRRIDERTGVPGPVRQRTAAPSPTCLAIADSPR